MDLMLRPSPDTSLGPDSAAEWYETVQFRRLDSNQDNQDQNLMSCQLLHAGRRRVEDRRSVASTIPSRTQTLGALALANGMPTGWNSSYGVVGLPSAWAMAARAQPSIRQYSSALCQREMQRQPW